MENMYSVKIFDDIKSVWPKRGVRVIAKNSVEAVSLAKKRKNISEEKKVLCRIKICAVGVDNHP